MLAPPAGAPRVSDIPSCNSSRRIQRPTHRDRRLTDVQPAGRGGEAAAFGHGDQRLEAGTIGQPVHVVHLSNYPTNPLDAACGREHATTMETNSRDWDASTYDRVAAPMTRRGVAILDRLTLRGGERVLDAGCGTGRVTAALL